MNLTVSFEFKTVEELQAFLEKIDGKAECRHLFDFEDSQGPVPAHRHPNGGGWVADTAYVAETAYVGPDARVFGNAWVYGYARVYGNAQVYGDALVYGYAQVYGYALVYGDALVYGYARVYGYALVYGYARVQGPVTKTPIVINGFPFTVTIEDELINIGCQSMTLKDWESENGRKAFDDEGYSNNYEKIMFLIKGHIDVRDNL